MTPSPYQEIGLKALVTTGLKEDGSSPNCEKEVYIEKLEAIVICEPPLLSRFVRIETENEGLNLCEVEVFGTGKNFLEKRNITFDYCYIMVDTKYK